MGTAGMEEGLLSKRGHGVLAVSPQDPPGCPAHRSAPLNPVGWEEAQGSDCICVLEIPIPEGGCDPTQ